MIQHKNSPEQAEAYRKSIEDVPTISDGYGRRIPITHIQARQNADIIFQLRKIDDGTYQFVQEGIAEFDNIDFECLVFDNDGNWEASKDIYPTWSELEEAAGGDPWA